jgi:hypothetical protein
MPRLYPTEGPIYIKCFEQYQEIVLVLWNGEIPS